MRSLILDLQEDVTDDSVIRDRTVGSRTHMKLASFTEQCRYFIGISTCEITIDTVAGQVIERASWFEWWAGEVAAHSMYLRHGLIGASVGTVESPQLYLVLDDLALVSIKAY